MNNPITVKTSINATIEKVWKLWTTPEHIMQWNNQMLAHKALWQQIILSRIKSKRVFMGRII